MELVSTLRQHRISTQSGDDVLQVHTMLLHAWCSLVRFHELYSEHPDVDFEGSCSLYPDQHFYSYPTDCGGSLSTPRPSADANPFDDAMSIQNDHAPPHATPSPSQISPGLSLGATAMPASQSSRRRRVGRRRNGTLSCPVSSCLKQNLSRIGLLDHV
jgi:hypothetical protein